MTDKPPTQKACCSGGPPPRVRKIVVGQAIVGLVGLDDALEQLYLMERKPGPETAAELVEMLALHNYIPPAARPLYEEALLREYADYCSEDGPEE